MLWKIDIMDFILAFAGSFALGSVYGFLQGAWPFGLVEAIWALVAARRWQRKRGNDGKSADCVVYARANKTLRDRLEIAVSGGGAGFDRECACEHEVPIGYGAVVVPGIVSPGARVKRRACTSLPIATGSIDLTWYPWLCAITPTIQP
jgi:hypothetical protein